MIDQTDRPLTLSIRDARRLASHGRRSLIVDKIAGALKPMSPTVSATDKKVVGPNAASAQVSREVVEPQPKAQVSLDTERVIGKISLAAVVVEAGRSVDTKNVEMLPDLERAILEDGTPSVKDNLFQTGLTAVSLSNEAWDALSKATMTLEVARRALVALEQQLGYIPGVSNVAANSRSIRHSPSNG